MSNHEPGSQPVTIFLGNVPVSTLNPLPTTGGGGGGGGIVTQGAGSHGQRLRRRRLAAVRHLLVKNDSVTVADNAAKTGYRLRRLVDGNGGAKDGNRVEVVERDATRRG